jgi:hypothetical protein
VCGFETWSLTLRKEQRLRVFQYRFLRKIFGSKRDKVIRKWRKLHSVEYHDSYAMPKVVRDIASRRMKWVGHIARILGSDESCIQGFGGET